jgi:hypothetical protein
MRRRGCCYLLLELVTAVAWHVVLNLVLCGQLLLASFYILFF